MKLELLTNVIDDAIRFTKGLQDRLTLSKKEDDKESKEPDYDNDKDQLEEDIRDINQKTTYQLF